MYPFNLPEQAVLVGVLPPAADAAGRTGDYISMKNLLRCFVVFHINQGNAATVALSISKATAVAPTGAVAMAETARIYHSLDQATSHQFTRATDAASYTTDAAVKDKIVVIEVEPGRIGETYDCIAPVTGASNAANITSAMIFGIPRVAGASTADVLVD
jgi:hypothetical protein